jgi:shikimate kinase
MSIVLIGYRGCGKTSIGKKLADRLWQPFVDTDDLVVKKAGGKSIKDIFEQDGEERFRQLEAEAIKEAAKLEEHVIALGGGGATRQENVKILRDAGHKLIYLRCEPAELFRRISLDPNTGTSRPPLTKGGGGIEEIATVMAQREPAYRAAAQAELDVTHLSVDEALVYVTRLA